MPVYSQEDGVLFGWESSDINNPTQEDFKQNGQYCQSGLAYPAGPDEARCTSFKEMKQADKVLPEPFACDPVNQEVQC